MITPFSAIFGRHFETVLHSDFRFAQIIFIFHSLSNDVSLDGGCFLKKKEKKLLPPPPPGVGENLTPPEKLIF